MPLYLSLGKENLLRYVNKVVSLTYTKQDLSFSIFPATSGHNFVAAAGWFTWLSVPWLATEFSWFVGVSSKMHWSDIMVLRVRGGVLSDFQEIGKTQIPSFLLVLILLLIYFRFRFFILLLCLVVAILWMIGEVVCDFDVVSNMIMVILYC